MRYILATLACAATLLAAFPAVAQAQTGAAKVSFEPGEDRYRIEYVHFSDDSGEALNHALYHTAEMLLRMGLVDFSVEQAYTFSEGAAGSDTGSQSVVDCGDFVCAQRLPLDAYAEASLSDSDAGVFVVIEAACATLRTAEASIELNVGPILASFETEQAGEIKLASVAP